MSEEETKDKYVMMFKPEYLGNRTISAGMYGTFIFSKNAEKIVKEDRGQPICKKLAEMIATPEGCTAFRDYVKTNPDFKVKGLEKEFNTYLVDTAKRKTTSLFTMQLISHDELVKAIDGENLETLAKEESEVITGNLHGSANRHESRIDGPRQMNR